MGKLLEFPTISSYVKFISLLTAIIATVLYYKFNHGKAKYFLVILWAIAIIEFAYKIVYYDITNEDYRAVRVLMNSYALFQTSFYLLWYRYLIKNLFLKKVILMTFFFNLLCTLLNSIFYQSFFVDVQRYSFVLGTLLVVGVILVYFKEILESDFVLKLNKSVYFWFSLGILAFNIPFLPVWVMAEYLGLKGDVYHSLLFVFNVIMHACFITGILWSKKEHNY